MGDILTRTLKNGRIAYYARYIELDGHRTSKATKAKTLEDAQKWLAAAEARVEAGLVGDKLAEKKAQAKAERERIAAEQAAREAAETAERNRLTVRQLAEAFKAEAQPDTWNLERYRRKFWSDYVNNVDPYIGGRIATEVKRTDVAKWRDKMKADGKGPRTILRGLGAASIVFNWALETDDRFADAHNPVEAVTKPSYKPKRELYTTDEVARLLDEAAKSDPLLHPIVAFAYFTGCRKGEIAALRWRDIDFQRHVIDVCKSFERDARKAGEPVVVGLNPHLRDILGPLAVDDDALVFPDPRDGNMRREYDSKGGCWGIRQLAERAKVRKLKQPWHSFRSSHATALEEAGATPSEIMRALGQKSIDVAMRYAQASPKKAAERVASLADPRDRANVIDMAAHRPLDTKGIREQNQADKKASGEHKS